MISLLVSACATLWPGIEVTPPAHEYTSAAGESAQIAVSLSRRPSQAIDVWAVSSDVREAQVSGPIRFTSSNWKEPQFFLVTGVDEATCDGERAYAISIHARWQGDPSGDWLVDEVYLINRDDCTGGDAAPARTSVLGDG